MTVCVGRDPKSGNPELFLPNRVTVRGETNYPWVVSNFGMVCTLINDISPHAAVYTVHTDKSRLPVEQYALGTLISHVSPRAAVYTVYIDKSCISPCISIYCAHVSPAVVHIVAVHTEKSHLLCSNIYCTH